ncbi:MAG: S1/P1 nuclease [Chthoniobacterales bacterium]
MTRKFPRRVSSRKILVIVLAVLPLCHSLRAYGPIGHQIVGAIADQHLANTPAGGRVGALLDGLTLEKASVIPDEIRGWDKRGADDPAVFHYSSHPRIDAQLRDFWRANQPTHDLSSPMPSHHWFHYTDVPVLELEKYRDGATGRTKWDIVHMIGYCISVLGGALPEENERKITKQIAVILLAHYVGDIHQPLHVGAEYFDEHGRAVNPDKGKLALADEGGNTLQLELSGAGVDPGVPRRVKLHGFWDNNSVIANLPQFPDDLSKEERRAKTRAAKADLVRRLAAEEPRQWRLAGNVAPKDFAEAWANEVLPIAREAYERLQFRNIGPKQEEDRVVAAGFVDEKPTANGISYREWSAQVVREELHKAGWRLADLLEKIVR